MTESTEPRTHRSRSERVLTDADIEQIVEEVRTADLDPTRAKILYPPDSRLPDRKAAMRPPGEPSQTSSPS